MNSSKLFIRPTKTLGFSLLEILTVITIIVVIATLAVPSFNGISESRSLNDSAGQIIAYLDATRQQALAQSMNVEVRIYTLPPQPPETFPRIGTFQAFRQNADNSYTALANPEHLSDRVAIAEEYSTLVNSSNLQSRSDGELAGKTSLNYHYFTFRSDGSTDLPLPTSGEEWYITLVLYRQIPTLPANTGSPPASNFVTIQIDPLTGRTQTFRPQ